MSIKSLAAATAAVFVLGTSSVDSGTVSLSIGDGGYFGHENWQTRVSQTVLDRKKPIGQEYNGRAGAFRFTDGVNAIIAFCIDPYTYLNLREDFTVTEGASVMENIDKLFNAAYSDVTDAHSASAFQVALWEVIAETDDIFDVTSGNHFIAGQDVSGTANDYLSRLATASTGGYVFTTYSNSGQDQISATAVPLPASALLLLGGLGGMVALRRKKT